MIKKLSSDESEERGKMASRKIATAEIHGQILKLHGKKAALFFALNKKLMELQALHARTSAEINDTQKQILRLTAFPVMERYINKCYKCRRWHNEGKKETDYFFEYIRILKIHDANNVLIEHFERNPHIRAAGFYKDPTPFQDVINLPEITLSEYLKIKRELLLKIRTGEY